MEPEWERSLKFAGQPWVKILAKEIWCYVVILAHRIPTDNWWELVSFHSKGQVVSKNHIWMVFAPSNQCLVETGRKLAPKVCKKRTLALSCLSNAIKFSFFRRHAQFDSQFDASLRNFLIFPFQTNLILTRLGKFSHNSMEKRPPNYHPVAPGSSPKHTIFAFFIYKSNLCCICHVKRTKIKKRPRLAH